MKEILKEARRLYNMGCATHWIQKNSKAPVKGGWSGPKRDTWDQLEKEFQPGFGLGVRLGQASRIGPGFLANIDIDVKSADERHRREALQFVRTQFPEAEKAPVVETGYGLRLFVCTKTPIQSRKLSSSGEETVVMMPTTQVNQRQRKAVESGVLSAAQLKAGYRVRPAWEVEFMSAGKQVVLPPSIHPDTKKPYIWHRNLEKPEDLPVIELKDGEIGQRKAEHGLAVVQGFRPVVVDYLDARFTDRIVDMILNGVGVEDRSAALLSVALTMTRRKFRDDEILTVLTDRDTFLGEVAYEHRHTNSRDAAVAWIRDYCLRKAKEETSAAKVFDCAVEVVTLGEQEAEIQKAELVIHDDWKQSLTRSQASNEASPIKVTLRNVLMVLEHEFGQDLFCKDLFSGYYIYGKDADCGGKAGEEFTDESRVRLTEWFARHWRIDVKAQMIFDAVGAIAMRNPFHPIRDYLTALRWDGTPRIDNWLERYLGAKDADSTYLKEVSRKFLVGMVKRALEPGCQFDYMLVLHGRQGIKKSSALRILAGEKYFSSTILRPDSRDTILKMASKWLLEFGEMSNAKADVKALKNFITMRVDRDRLPYDRASQDFPRKCVFAGSTNEDEVIFDTTGGRRFWVVSVDTIDLAGLARDRDQLFAEAMGFYDTGEPLYLSEAAEAAAKAEQAKWTAEDVVTEMVGHALATNEARAPDDSFKFPVTGFSLSQIFDVMHLRKEDMQMQKRVANGLRSMGYTKRDTRINGRIVKLWFSVAPQLPVVLPVRCPKKME